MGAAALQKYIGSLGGIGTSGVGSSSSYSPKELNKEITPEKVDFWLKLKTVMMFGTVYKESKVEVELQGNITL